MCAVMFNKNNLATIRQPVPGTPKSKAPTTPLDYPNCKRSRLLLGCDWLIYQDLPDLEAAVAGPKFPGRKFDSSCFNGEYVTGVEPGYFARIEQLRSDEAKKQRRAS